MTTWATAIGGTVAPSPIDVEVVEVAGRSSERPAGKRFGALVHAVLATVDLGAGAKSVRALPPRRRDCSAPLRKKPPPRPSRCAPLSATRC